MAATILSLHAMGSVMAALGNDIILSWVIILGLTGIALIAAAGFAIHDTVIKNRIGVNLDPSQCPRCHTALPSNRVPKSFKQALWDIVWVRRHCPNCGCVVDKWGREITHSHN